MTDYLVEHEFDQIGQRTMLLNASRIRHAGDRPDEILLAFEDITDRKRAEDAHALNAELEQRVAQRTQELELLSEAITHLGEGVLITDADLDQPGPRIVFVNDAVCRISGYSANELIGQSPRILQGEETSDKLRTQIRRELAAGRSCLVELVNYRKDGTRYDAELYMTPLHDAAGRCTNFVSIHRDITERKRAERERARLAAIVNSSEDAIFSLNLDGIIKTWNQGAQRLYGYSSDEAIGQPIFMIEAPDAPWGWHQLLEQIQRGEQMTVVETKHQRKDRSQVDVSERVSPILETRRRRKDSSHVQVALSVAPISNEQGQIVGVSAIVRDITEQKRAEAALRESEERLRAVLDTAADAIISIDQHGIISSINPATVQMFGYAQDELLGQNVNILMPPPCHDQHDGYIARYLETGEARIIGIGREFVGRHKDGSKFPIGLAVSEVHHLGLFTGVIRDISAVKELQKEVLEIAADEDRRIGHELHDNTQQQLTGLGLLASSLAAKLGKEASPHTALATRLADGIKESTAHVHLLARGLVPVDIDAEGLRSALADLAERIVEQYGVQCEFRCSGNIDVTDNFVATHLYRIVQEAINNAIKHGQANRIEISLDEQNDVISLQVQDNGIGIDANKPAEIGGMGLRIIQYRASLIGAAVQIGPGAAGGTLVSCDVFGGGVICDD